LHEENAGLGEIISIEEFAVRRAGAPTSHGRCSADLRFMELADQRGQDVRALQVVVVIGAIHISRHGADEIASVLPSVSLAHFDPGDFGNRIPLIRRLEWSGEQILLLHRLGREFRVDARAAKEEQLVYARLRSAVNQIILNLQILVKERGRLLIVCENAPDFRSRDKDILRLSVAVELVYGRRIEQIEFLAWSLDQVDKLLALQLAPNSAPDQPAMARHINPRIVLHLPHTIAQLDLSLQRNWTRIQFFETAQQDPNKNNKSTMTQKQIGFADEFC
jgi:hypothetical protein